MPTRSSWSNNSSSTCLPSLRRASPRRQSARPAQPDRCSGDFGGGGVDSIQFFVRIGKVGLRAILPRRRGGRRSHLPYAVASHPPVKPLHPVIGLLGGASVEGLVAQLSRDAAGVIEFAVIRAMICTRPVRR